MAIKTWNGTTGSFDDPSSWSPTGVPQPGDTAIINSGTVGITGDTLVGLAFQVSGSGGATTPTLDFTDSILTNSAYLFGNNAAAYNDTPINLNVFGQFQNDGIIVLTGSRYDLQFAADSGGNQPTFGNVGSLNLVGSSPVSFAAAGTGVGTIDNTGTIAFWNPSDGFQSPTIAQNVIGQGVITLAPNARTDFSQAVGVGQTIRVEGGAGASSILQLDDVGAFQGTITGFASGDLIAVTNTPFTQATYVSTGASSGTLNLFSGTTLEGSLNFSGAYQLSSFGLNLVTSGNGTNLQITTTATPAQDFSYTDTVVDLSTSDAGTAYTGSVSAIQQQYTLSSPNPTAIRANVAGTDVSGGAGSDAIQVAGGTNIIDGGSGSNFLVGAGAGAGAGSQDNFFMNGSAGANWDTIVNFHAGDVATFFGFNAGTSTVNWTATDGAAGYQGVTLHSELNGAGTGFNGSITFAGLSQATEQSSFAITTGAGYIQIAYT